MGPINLKSRKVNNSSKSRPFDLQKCRERNMRRALSGSVTWDGVLLLSGLLAALGADEPVAGTPLARFAASYGSHMVLQQEPRRAVVWGYYGGSETAPVVLQLDGKPVQVANGHEPGSWIAKLPPTPGGTQPHTLTLRASEAGDIMQTLEDVRQH